MLAEARQAIAALSDIVRSLDPARVDGPRARELMVEFARAERLAAAGAALMARRVDETSSYDRTRHRSAAHYLSKVSGVSIGAATTTIKTAQRLDDLPATDRAFRAGRLSTTQAGLVTEAATADPTAEAKLLESAAHDGVRGLRSLAAMVLAASRDDKGERIRSERSWRHWADLDGSGRIAVRGPLELTARVAKALEPFEQELFEAARTSGTRERVEARMFDALVAMADASSGTVAAPPSGPRTTLVVRIDHHAFITGKLGSGEVCEIAGVGPIPVAVAQRLADDAFLKAIVTDGVDVRAIAHLGRTIPAHLRTALDELFPECSIAGCHVGAHLEIDHNEPIEAGGLTELANLNKLCPYHHDEKHRRNLRLVGDGLRKTFVPAAEWMPPERRCAPLAAV